MSSIEWTDRTWNPIVGCSRVSPGCENCYAERQVRRELAPQHKGLTVVGKHGPRWTGEVRVVEHRLAEPLHWRKPQRVFVNSLSDLFHEQLANETIALVFGVMAAAPHITFQVLTKRPDRMRAWFAWAEQHGDDYDLCRDDMPSGLLTCAWEACSGDAWGDVEPGDHGIESTPSREQFGSAWPLPNVWLGVTAEDQLRADQRIPHLLLTPAAKRFVSYEPALEAVDLGLATGAGEGIYRHRSRWVNLHRPVSADLASLTGDASVAREGVHRAISNKHGALSVTASSGRMLGIRPEEFTVLDPPDWIICGGESGPKARPFDLAWARSAVEQCKTAGVSVFVKQLGARPRAHPLFKRPLTAIELETSAFDVPLASAKGNDMSEWSEFPELRVREFPR